MEHNTMEQRREGRIWQLWIAVCLSTVLLNVSFGWSFKDELDREYTEVQQLNKLVQQLNKLHDDVLNMLKDVLNMLKSQDAMATSLVTMSENMKESQAQVSQVVQYTLQHAMQVLTPDQTFREEMLNTLETLKQHIDSTEQYLTELKQQALLLPKVAPPVKQ